MVKHDAASSPQHVLNHVTSSLKTLLFYCQVDAALIATGRAPFTQGLGLENVRTQ